MSITRTANIGFDGSTVTTTFGKAEVRAISAKYGDKLEPEMQAEMGAQDQSEQTPGKYSTEEVEIVFSALRFRTEIMPLFPANGAGNVRVPIVVGRTHPDLGSDSDLLENCRCINWGAAVENSSKAETVTTKWTTMQVKWTDRRVTINKLPGVEQGTGSF